MRARSTAYAASAQVGRGAGQESSIRCGCGVVGRRLGCARVLPLTRRQLRLAVARARQAVSGVAVAWRIGGWDARAFYRLRGVSSGWLWRGPGKQYPVWLWRGGSEAGMRVDSAAYAASAKVGCGAGQKSSIRGGCGAVGRRLGCAWVLPLTRRQLKLAVARARKAVSRVADYYNN